MHKTEYLFLPEDLKEILIGYPNLSKEISGFTNEGTFSKAFPKARKSPRQIYRILSNQHYPNLVQLLENIETCLSHGYTNIDILRIRDTSQFTSAVAEIQIASSLITKGFNIRGFDQNKRNRGVPDIQASNENSSFVAEIYKPRDFEGLNLFVDDIRLFIKYLDLPFDFICKVKYVPLKEIDFLRLLHINVWDFSIKMENKKHRTELENKIFSSIYESMESENRTDSLIKEFPIEEYNLKVIIKFKQIQESKLNYPIREISQFPPSLSGFAPDLMFDLLIKNKLLRKIEKAQVHNISGEHLKLLIVDVSGLIYANSGEFEHFIYLPKFKKTLHKYLTESCKKEDLIVFCLPSYNSELRVKLLYMGDLVNKNDVHSILGKISEKIIVKKV